MALVASFMAGFSPAVAAPPPVAQISAQVVSAPPARIDRIAFPDGVTGLDGLTYAQPLGYRPLQLDLYLPSPDTPRPAQGYPLVVFVHGGAWMMGDRHLNGAITDFPGVLASLAARGYVVASVSYRLSGEARFPAPISDVRTAIRWLRSHAAPYRIDPAKGMTWGVSAGGHLAGLAAMGCDVDGLDAAVDKGKAMQALSGISACVQASVTWYGVFDLTTIAQQAKALPGAMRHDVPDAAEWRELGCVQDACKPEAIDLASTVKLVNAKSPPMLLMAGTLDKTVPHQQSIEMHEALDRAGVANTLILVPGVDHSFVGTTPEQTRAATQQALDATFAYIDKAMKQ